MLEFTSTNKYVQRCSLCNITVAWISTSGWVQGAHQFQIMDVHLQRSCLNDND